MNKINKHIEIVVTDIDGLSLMPKATQNLIYKILKNNYMTVSVVSINSKADLENLIARSPDLVLLGIKCIEFEGNGVTDDSIKKVWIADSLEKAGIRYTGSETKSLQLEFDKSKAKEKIQKKNINTASFFLAQPNQFTKREDIPIAFPLFIKPLYEGDGRGIDLNSVVYDFAGYTKKIRNIFEEFKTPALVEKYLSGREFTVGIMDDGLGNLLEMPLEIIALENDSGERILGEKEKNEDNETVVFVDDSVIYKDISLLAKKAFTALGAKGFGRIDIRMDAEDIPYFLEANLIPGLGYGYFFRACHINQKMTHEEMILRIVELGLNTGVATE